MTIYLKNTTNDQSIVLRYGEALQLMIQINPNEEKELPTLMSKGLLKHYLSTFKTSLKVIEKTTKEVTDAPKANSTKTQVSEKKTETKNEEESPNNVNVDGADKVSGENDSNKVEKYTKKQLENFNAKKIKEIAESLGIEVTEESTKKNLTPIILNKQGE